MPRVCTESVLVKIQFGQERIVLSSGKILQVDIPLSVILEKDTIFSKKVLYLQCRFYINFHSCQVNMTF